MPELIKPGFARKAVQKQARNFFRTFFSIARNKYLTDFVFYVIMILIGWAMLCLAIMAGWNWGVVSTFPIMRPMDFIAAMGWSIIVSLIFLFLYLLGEVK